MGVVLVKIFFYFWMVFMFCFWGLQDYLAYAQGQPSAWWFLLGQALLWGALFYFGKWVIRKLFLSSATDVDTGVKQQSATASEGSSKPCSGNTSKRHEKRRKNNR